jgi:UDP-GlcNAc:undecaprenyl-phosphate/decaprenyl-phosphate GlcNAc-1-phosphate transferase
VSKALLPTLVLAISFALSAALVPAAAAIARRYGIIDSPGPRKIHAAPTPRIGGLAVWAAFTAVVLTGYFGVPLFAKLDFAQRTMGAELALLGEAYRVQDKLLAVILGGAVVFVVGLLDDLLGPRFGPGWKLVGIALAALALVMAEVHTDFLSLEPLNVLVSLVWVIGITNAFNLLDNMDGLSAGVAVIASFILLLNAWLLGEFFVSLVLTAFIGSLLGFLLFNWHPASVFLGDCGSLFIGFTLAALTLLERFVTHAPSTYFPVLMPVIVLALPILDTTTVVLIRLHEHRPIYVGDSRHLSHRLVSLGMSRPLAVATIYLITLGLGLGAVVLPHATPLQSAIVLAQTCAFVAVVVILLFYERRTQSRAELS